MATLIVRLDRQELQHCAIGSRPVTIGRLPDNTIVLDSPAVSGRHARVYRDGQHVVLEDLKSTNGTFVNDKPVARHTLVDHDVVLIGRHTLHFSEQGSAPSLSGLEHGRPSQVYDAVVPKTAIPTAQGRIGMLKVIDGVASQPVYLLTAVTTIIGAAESAQVRVTGWFKPKTAAAIARKGDGFSITPMGGRVLINGQRADGRRDLANGDRIEVAGLTLQFSLS